jgi:hypothetical protein
MIRAGEISSRRLVEIYLERIKKYDGPNGINAYISVASDLAMKQADEEVAEEALELIQVDYEELAPLLDPEQALLPDSPPIHPELENVKNNVAYSIGYTRGNLDQGLRQADLILQDRFAEIKRQQNCAEVFFIHPLDHGVIPVNLRRQPADLGDEGSCVRLARKAGIGKLAHGTIVASGGVSGPEKGEGLARNRRRMGPLIGHHRTLYDFG